MKKFVKRRLKSVDSSWTDRAGHSLWSQYDSHGEPPLDEVLDDPIVKALAASDRVTRSEIDTLVKIIRGYRASR